MNSPDFEKFILTDKQIIAKIESALRETYFVDYEEGFLETELGVQDLEANVFNRYNNSLRHVVPWVGHYIDLKGKSLIEIGSGTGSSTAAFAHFVDSINGYDIHEPSIAGARKRLDILDLKNARIDLITADKLASKVETDHKEGIDIVLLFAVLEHQTVEERITTIQKCWQLLKPYGLLVVAETPNLLQYFDFHTSLLPFLHILPTDLYARYAKYSPRNGFNNNFDDFESRSLKELDVAVTRWGRGVSFHEFALALGNDYAKYIIANGFEKEIISWVDVSLEEEVLRYYIEKKGLTVPSAFTRVSLNFIMRKNDQGQACGDTNVPAFAQVVSPDVVALKDDRIRELEATLLQRDNYLSDILNSKRWKWANAVSSPYRLIKTKLAGGRE